MYLTRARRRFAALDIETGGFSAERHDILEVAICLQGRNGKPCIWSSLVRPTVDIPARSTAVHGISLATYDAEPSVSIADALRTIRTLICPGILIIGHNIGTFDLRFLAAKGLDLTRTNPVHDTLIAERRIQSGLGVKKPSLSLEKVAEKYGIIPAGEAHRAENDAVLAYHIAKKQIC